ncbi:hypothetical protein PR202_gb11678 [Eleusine coracana subsp. coracana]|uniref:Uncharacterized protein n=1 Tax=Eleusine coracana subsp. coracana TaxID=191504 RepID=A0AAV5EN58_ELECO|nr:hypothetical protein PR202_gb11678 [Eleusine coracana subsp. coracana]
MKHSMNTVREKFFQGRPRNVSTLSVRRRGSPVMLQNWNINPVFEFATSHPCAVNTFCYPRRGRRATRWRLWKNAVASPYIKSTVPYTLQLR